MINQFMWPMTSHSSREMENVTFWEMLLPGERWLTTKCDFLGNVTLFIIVYYCSVRVLCAHKMAGNLNSAWLAWLNFHISGKMFCLTRPESKCVGTQNFLPGWPGVILIFKISPLHVDNSWKVLFAYPLEDAFYLSCKFHYILSTVGVYSGIGQVLRPDGTPVGKKAICCNMGKWLAHILQNWID